MPFESNIIGQKILGNHGKTFKKILKSYFQAMRIIGRQYVRLQKTGAEGDLVKQWDTIVTLYWRIHRHGKHKIR